MKRAIPIACVAMLISACAANAPAPANLSETFDVLITNGRVVDGTGAPWFRADVGIIGDRIAAIGQLAGRDAKTRVDASNLVVAPGFIDMLGQSEFNVLVDPRAASKITQGITTEITGEGTSIAPLNDALVKQRSRSTSVQGDRSTSARLANTSPGSSARRRRSTSAASSAPVACAPT